LLRQNPKHPETGPGLPVRLDPRTPGRRNHILHITKEIRGKEILIGNNLGRINGWASTDDAVAIVTAVQD
jgi:hypothetical protein